MKRYSASDREIIRRKLDLWDQYPAFFKQWELVNLLLNNRFVLENPSASPYNLEWLKDFVKAMAYVSS